MAIRLNPDLLPNLLLSIQQSRQNLDTATQQLSTGKKVNELSDDPSAVAQLVHIHNQANQDDQFLKNQSTLQSQFQVADSTLSNVVTALTRALSIGTEGANGTLNNADRQAIAGEVQGIANQLLSLANVSYRGAYLFAGTAVTTPPFTINPATLAVTYNGNAKVTQVQLSNGNVIGNNLPGSQLFLNGNGNVFGALQSLYTSLQSNTNIAGAVIQVQDALSEVSTQRVFYGNGLNQISLSESFLNQEKVDLSTQENSLVGVDPAKAASDLSQAQTAYQSELAATAKILNLPSLLNFLQ
ncbi:MAG: flagellar hook-associated protein FlgL [Acidobacteria bacterium]|nr:flagellar hook-associated protein FlgL [Acidobacteriota bacterium]MBS1865966.1 flagellar hook-associated protein FlgL [Acidobacteriota bacterium]